MSKAIIALGMEAFTAELRVRFKQKLRAGEKIKGRARVGGRNDAELQQR